MNNNVRLKGFSRWAQSSVPIEDGLKECYSKAAYRTEEFAKDVLAKRKEKTSSELRIYRCRVCALFHFTHTKQKA